MNVQNMSIGGVLAMVVLVLVVVLFVIGKIAMLPALLFVMLALARLT
jgi:hypothetical protein